MRQPLIRYLDDAPKDDWWVLEEDFQYGEEIVPKGYVSNGCSVPRLLWPWFPPKDAYFVAGMFHDYLYETQKYSRQFSDWIFLQLLNETAPKTPIRNYIRFLVVRTLGWYNWRRVKYIDITNYKEA